VPSVVVVGVRLHDNPVDGVIAATRETVLANPLRLLSVMVDTPAAPETACRLDGLAAIEKSCSVKVTETAWESPLKLAVTVTV